MKLTYLALLITLFGLNSVRVQAEDVCTDAILGHLKIINTSEEYLKELGSHPKEISAFEITQMQKNMTIRNLSLKKMQATYQDPQNNCSPSVLSTAVSVYDYSLTAKSIFAQTSLRRIFLGFAKFKPYQLTEYLADYKKYTSNIFTEEVLTEIKNTETKLPEGVELRAGALDYDPNLYAPSDFLIKEATSLIAGAARIWGFISDHLKWRNGRIKDNAEAITILKEKLKPLDLVYETRTFTLSNLTIPGHWGHVGIWLGTEEELRALGIWDQDYFAEFRPYVLAGKNIIEIRKEGINFQGLDTFINLDEIAVTRIKDIQTRASSVYEELSHQTSKKYDFKFDARTMTQITCAELVTFSYGNIQWPLTDAFFQYSVRPDDLAVLTLDSTSPAEFVLYFKGNTKKEGGGFTNMTYDQWAELFKIKRYYNDITNI